MADKTRQMNIRLSEKQYKEWRRCLERTDLTNTQLANRFIEWLKNSDDFEVNKKRNDDKLYSKIIKSIASIQARSIIEIKEEHQLPWDVDSYQKRLTEYLIKNQ